MSFSFAAFHHGSLGSWGVFWGFLFSTLSSLGFDFTTTDVFVFSSHCFFSRTQHQPAVIRTEQGNRWNREQVTKATDEQKVGIPVSCVLEVSNFPFPRSEAGSACCVCLALWVFSFSALGKFLISGWRVVSWSLRPQSKGSRLFLCSSFSCLLGKQNGVVYSSTALFSTTYKPRHTSISTVF